jgi:biopolymer transport protein ExbD
MTGSNDDQNLVTGINVTPLVDIMLVLLIIFMVTASFVSEAGLQVSLPKAQTTEASSTASLVIQLAVDGKIALMDEAMDLNGLRAVLEREVRLNPAVRVTLRADRRLDYGRVVEALDIVKQAGVKKVALAAERN